MSIRSNLLGRNVMLVDHGSNDGGFCVVPGSHKSNFKMPEGMVDGINHSEYIQQPVTKAGDVVFFLRERCMVLWGGILMFKGDVPCMICPGYMWLWPVVSG